MDIFGWHSIFHSICEYILLWGWNGHNYTKNKKYGSKAVTAFWFDTYTHKIVEIIQKQTNKA